MAWHPNGVSIQQPPDSQQNGNYTLSQTPTISFRKRFGLKMKLFNRFRSKKNTRPPPLAQEEKPKITFGNGNGYYISAPLGPNYIKRLDRKTLARIFGFVCPHALDTSYTISDQVDLGKGCCMLCNLRDLAHCSRVCRSWHNPAVELLYGSIRIDHLHYCPLEEVLRETRRKKNRRSRFHYDPDNDYVYDPTTDAAQERVRLLADTLRSNYWLGSLVKYLKLPFNIREEFNRDVARAVGCCPNLKYVDLANDFYYGDSRYDALRSELRQNCPNIAIMTYKRGSERFFQALINDMHWKKLEILKLENLQFDIGSLRYVMSCLSALHTLVLTDLSEVTDDIFTISPGLPEFPALTTLELHNLPGITSSGVFRYFTSSQVRDKLKSLTLDNTGVPVTKLQTILSAATNLQSLTLINTVSAPLGLDPLPALRSPTLETMHFEIITAQGNIVNPPPADSYNHYLLTSIIGGNLPSLRSLYVRDPNFPAALTSRTSHYPSPTYRPGSFLSASTYNGDSPTLPLTPQTPIQPSTSPFDSPESVNSLFQDPRPPLTSTHALINQAVLLHNQPRPRRRTMNSAPQPPSNMPTHRFLQPIEVYTKGNDDTMWSFKPLHRPEQAPPGTVATRRRPLSMFNKEWGAHARRSVLIADGAGGFLAVPEKELPAAPIPEESPYATVSPSVSTTPLVGGSEPAFSPRTENNLDHERRKRKSWWPDAGVGPRGSQADLWR